MIGMMFEMTLDLDKLKQVREVVLYRYVFGIAWHGCVFIMCR